MENDNLPSERGPAFKKPAPGTLQRPGELAEWVRTTVGGMSETPSDIDFFDLLRFMVAASVVGADEHRLARILDLQPERVAVWAENLRRNGLLRNGRVLDANWFKDSGKTAFIVDTLVAQGYVVVVGHSVDGPVYDCNRGRHPSDKN